MKNKRKINKNRFIYTDEDMVGITIIKKEVEPAKPDALVVKEIKAEEMDTDGIPWEGVNYFSELDYDDLVAIEEIEKYSAMDNKQDEGVPNKKNIEEDSSMEKDKYRECLVDVIDKLEESRQAIFNAILNLTMAGELKEWNESIAIGEVYDFDTELFEGCNDVNVQLLTKILRSIESTIDSIENINNLGE